MEVIRARHENINGRLKQWAILNNMYRHKHSFHGKIFRCLIVMEQLWIEEGKVLFQVTDFVHDYAIVLHS